MNYFFYILKNIEKFVQSSIKRNINIPDVSMNLLLEKCSKYKENIHKLSLLRRQRNLILLSAEDIKEKSNKFINHKDLSQNIEDLNIICCKEYDYLLSIFQNLPNVLDDIVDENNEVIVEELMNKEINSLVGAPEKFWDDYILKDKGAYMSGAKFAVLSTKGSLIMRRIKNILVNNAEQDYNELYLPVIVNKAALFNSSHASFFMEDLFALKDEDKFLIPTSEVTILNFHHNENLEELKRYFCICNCFRKEAGSYGKSNFLIQRLHQFSKLELFVFCSIEQCEDELKKMINTACNILRKFSIPFRLIRNSIIDTSPQASKTYDIEVWCPSFGWMEISSCSNINCFQSIRSNVKINGEYAITLNGTGLACERLFICILDNYWNDLNSMNKILNITKN